MAATLREAFDLWPEEALEAIHSAALELLSRGGVRVESPPARELLTAAGCALGPQDRVLVPPGVVEAALASCPREFVLVARDDTWSLTMDPEPGPTYAHNMGGAAYMSDPRSGEHRRATLRDQIDLARVMHRLRHQHTLTPLIQPGDVPDMLEPLYSFLALAGETDKYVGGPGISFPAQARYLREMAIVLTGSRGAAGRYPLDLAFSPVSPLILGGDVSEALIDTARSGQSACEILPCPSAGTTAPASIAAAVAQQHAEVLAGVVLVQAAAPGTPTYYGPRLSAMDPRTGAVLSGTPETGTSSIAATLLARRCGLACDCYGPTSDAKVLDAQFGHEHASNALLGLLARPRLLSGIGDVQAGASTNLEALVIDDDVLAAASYSVTPRPWDADALDVDAMIEGALSGKGFLGTKHTRRYLRSEFVTPLVSYRGGLGEWLASGDASVVDIASRRVAELVAQEPVGLPDEVARELCRLIDAAAAELEVGGHPDPRRALAETG
jgi:trimethylamine---corrinoid protein Co-methyltransferase